MFNWLNILGALPKAREVFPEDQDNVLLNGHAVLDRFHSDTLPQFLGNAADVNYCLFLFGHFQLHTAIESYCANQCKHYFRNSQNNCSCLWKTLKE